MTIDDLDQKINDLEKLLENGTNYIDMSDPQNPNYSKVKVTENDVDIKFLLEITKIYKSME